jgi:hypothetical protein
MLKLDQIKRNNRLMRATTGLTQKAFDAILTPFSEVYDASLEQPGVRRQRALGGGRKSRLVSHEEKLYFILLYCKCYPTMDLLGLCLGLIAAVRVIGCIACCRWSRRP